MVSFTKKIMLFCLFISVSLFAGCGSTAKNQMPDTKPKDFNFVFNYGVNAKNQLDTFKGQYTRDMITEESVTTELKLTEEEMNSIYLEMKKIDIMNYPDKFNPKGNVKSKPFTTYSLKIVINKKEKNIYWKNEILSDTKEANQLKEVFKKIYKVIESKEEYKKLPMPKGGYD